MPIAPIFAAAGAGASSTRTHRLYIAGADVLLEYGAAGNSFGVPIETIELVEAGAGGVSSLTFVLEDPLSECSIAEDDPVYYEDVANDRPLFRGFILSWDVEPFAGIGRRYIVRATGVEVLLDWLIVDSLTLAAGTKTYVAIQSAAAAAQGVGVALRWGAQSLTNSLANPVSILGTDDLNAATMDYAVTLSRVSLREAIRAIAAAGPNHQFVSDLGNPAVYARATVDFYFGLRVGSGGVAGVEYATLTVPSGSLVPESLQQTYDGTSRVRQVLVTGGNAAGSGIVSDGSGKPGQVGSLNDSTILTAAQRDRLGQAYIAEKSLVARGTLELNDNTISTNVRAGSTLALTDSQTGATGSYEIGAISKRMLPGGGQDWSVTFGGLPASFATALRRLTRGTLQ